MSFYKFLYYVCNFLLWICVWSSLWSSFPFLRIVLQYSLSISEKCSVSKIIIQFYNVQSNLCSFLLIKHFVQFFEIFLTRRISPTYNCSLKFHSYDNLLNHDNKDNNTSKFSSYLRKDRITLLNYSTIFMYLVLCVRYYNPINISA